jgi:hypothetical protein
MVRTEATGKLAFTDQTACCTSLRRLSLSAEAALPIAVTQHHAPGTVGILICRRQPAACDRWNCEALQEAIAEKRGVDLLRLSETCHIRCA